MPVLDTLAVTISTDRPQITVMHTCSATPFFISFRIKMLMHYMLNFG